MTTSITFRTDAELKADVEDILEDIGMNMSTAFWTHITRQRKKLTTLMLRPAPIPIRSRSSCSHEIRNPQNLPIQEKPQKDA